MTEIRGLAEQATLLCLRRNNSPLRESVEPEDTTEPHAFEDEQQSIFTGLLVLGEVMSQEPLPMLVIDNYQPQPVWNSDEEFASQAGRLAIVEESDGELASLAGPQERQNERLEGRPVYFAVYRMDGVSSIAHHNSIWVGDRCYEVAGKESRSGRFLYMRDEPFANEQFAYLGQCTKTNEEIEKIVNGYSGSQWKYMLLGNNCWDFAHWLMRELEFRPYWLNWKRTGWKLGWKWTSFADREPHNGVQQVDPIRTHRLETQIDA